MAPVAAVGGIPLAIAHHNTSPTLMQTVFALPTLAAVPMSLIVGSLAGRTGKKIPLQLGILAMLLGGTAITFSELPLAGFIAAMVVIGLGLGCLMTLSSGLVADHFHGNEQSKVMAHMSAFANVGGMTMATAGGVLLAMGWSRAFGAFLFAIPILIACHVFLPKDSGNHAAAKSEAKVQIKLNARVFIFCCMAFIMGLCFGIRSANAGLLVLEHGLGEPALANYATTFWTAAGIVMGFIYGMAAKILRKSLMPVFIGIFAVGMALMGNATDLWMFYLGHVFAGMGIATAMPTVISLAARSVDSGSSTFAISLIFATLNIAGFLAPMVVNTIAGMTGSVTAQACFNIGAVLMAVLFAYSIFFVCNKPKKAIGEDV
jgi:MFS family permease